MAEYYGIHYDSVIEHHGVRGQKWGMRRYQNPDGTLTPLGRKKLGRIERKVSKLGNNVNQSKSRYMQLAKKKKNGTATEKELKEYEALSSSLKKASSKFKKMSSKLESKKKNLEKNQPKEKPIDEVIRTGSKEDILRRSGELTVAELNEAFQRLDVKARIDRLDTSKVGAGEKFAKRLAKVAGTVASVYDSVEKVTKVTNALGLTDIKFGQKKNDAAAKFVNTASAKDLWAKRASLTPEQKAAAVKRMNTEAQIKKMADKQKAAEEAAKKAAEEAQAKKEKEKADAKAKKEKEKADAKAKKEKEKADAKAKEEQELRNKEAEEAAKRREAWNAYHESVVDEHVQNLYDEYGSQPYSGLPYHKKKKK